MSAKKEMRAALKALGSERPSGSGGMTELILRSPLYKQALTVLAFYAVAPEPDTLPIMKAALSEGKRLCLPRTHGGGEMDARLITSLSDLETGRYGIPEPSERCETVAKQAVDLVLVPGLAFDWAGYRLGHGAGYYDRYLKGFEGVSLGLCFEQRLTQVLPRDDCDLPVSHIVTEKRLFSCPLIKNGG